eukprot:scaffold25634_cov90-Skeletonema_dohrnii-CCMP3373.AAC.2
MIVWKRLYHGSSIVWAYRRRYNVVGDLMRNLGWPQKHLYHGSSIVWTYRHRYNIVGDIMRPSETLEAPQLTAISYLTL